jgi:hypothetical protein
VEETEPPAALAGTLPVRSVTVAADLATPAGLDAVFAATGALEVGLVVANAAYSPSGLLRRHRGRGRELM